MLPIKFDRPEKDLAKRLRAHALQYGKEYTPAASACLTRILFISLAKLAHKKDYDDAVIGYVSDTVNKVDDKFHVVSAAQALMPQRTILHTVQHTVTVTTTATAPTVTETERVEVEVDGPECPDRHALWVDPFPHLNTTINVPPNIVFDPKGPRSDQIVILTATDGKGHNADIKDVVELARQNRDEYAKHHGYVHHFINVEKYDLIDVAPVWKKLPAIVETFNKFPEAQWVFWLDADAIIMEPEVTLQDLLLSKAGQKKNFHLGAELMVVSNEHYKNFWPREPDFENVDFIVAQDGQSLNAGSFLMRRSQFTQMLLDMWADPLFMYASFSNKEQDAMVRRQGSGDDILSAN